MGTVDDLHNFLSTFILHITQVAIAFRNHREGTGTRSSQNLANIVCRGFDVAILHETIQFMGRCIIIKNHQSRSLTKTQLDKAKQLYIEGVGDLSEQILREYFSIFGAITYFYLEKSGPASFRHMNRLTHLLL